MKHASRGYLMILVSSLCFASYGIWSRLLGNDFGIFFQGWVRSALILTVLIPIALYKKDFKPIFGKGTLWFWVTMSFTVFTQVPLYYAYNHLTLGTTILIFYSLSLITSYLIGWMFIGERITPVKLVAIVLAILGLFFTFGFSLATFSLAGLLLAAFSGVASGGEVASTKKSTHYFSSLQLSVYSWFFILITHLPISYFSGEHWAVPALNAEWFAMLAYAGTGLLGLWLVIEGFRYVDASVGGLVGLTEVLFSVSFGYLLFRDHLSLSVIFGGILIVLAAMLPDVYAILTGKKSDVVPLREI